MIIDICYCYYYNIEFMVIELGSVIVGGSICVLYTFQDDYSIELVQGTALSLSHSLARTNTLLLCEPLALHRSGASGSNSKALAQS